MDFSGGGQFVRRFLLVHPERLCASIFNVAEVFNGKNIDFTTTQRAFVIQLVIGERDLEVPGKGIPKWLAARNKEGEEDNKSSSLRLPSQGGRQVIEELQHGFSAGKIRSELALIPGAAHDSPVVLPSV
ncbi:hypothetical protein AOQ84DRAFT_373241 [Glonium stellatum]|uniref:Uncharacterized protein n=1 Tax=Glonium stellatum TaxID=574774 RepID=A0A8E2F888_9PEZI|nr:hypothetical protein AOQ84DRAFT_373241 [Glonium stellatum]